MCELFAASALRKVWLNGLLEEFFSHGKDHPHGWGMAFLSPHGAATEKEPAASHKSSYLRHRLTSPIYSSTLIAHIRLATKGSLDYQNTHPFTKEDKTGRAWTLAHNGTIFDCGALNRYALLQQGGTDSERILMYIIDRINDATAKKALRLLKAAPRYGTTSLSQTTANSVHKNTASGAANATNANGGELAHQEHGRADTVCEGNSFGAHVAAADGGDTSVHGDTGECCPSGADSPSQTHQLTAHERFCVIESVIREITPENKVNLLLFDGELLYAHTNYRASLHFTMQDDVAFISTRSLSTLHWQELPMNTLLAFNGGKVVYTGRAHANEFFDSEEKMRLLFIDYSSL